MRNHTTPNPISPLAILTVFALIITALAAPVAVAERVFHVSPTGSDEASGASPAEAFGSIIRARDAIRALKADGALTGPVTVRIAGGQYEITEPLVFGPEDSGAADAPIAYVAAPGETPVIFGGRSVTGWQVGDDGRWTVTLPAVRDGDWYFQQLFVNGDSMPRTRLPREGFYRIEDFPNRDRDPWSAPSDWFLFAEGDIRADWRNLNDVEVVIPRFWVSSRQKIDRVDPDERRVQFTFTSRYRYSDDFSSSGARYFIENVAEALDTPGQWYLDRPTGVLTYLPRPGETPDTVSVVAPVARHMLLLEGDAAAGRMVEHLRFEGLTFTCSNWMLPDGNPGDAQSAPAVDGAVILTGARHCAIERCVFTDLNSYGIEMRDGCQRIRIAGNDMMRLGGGGIRMSGGAMGDHPDLRTGWNTIADNRILHIGLTYHAATGVFLQHSGSNRIVHNEIGYTYYSGITVGWIWGYRPSVSTHNEFAFNHIHHIGQGFLSDMGAIYTLGVSPGTVIRNNLIHDVHSHGYGGWGIYPDEGSSHLLVEDNIVYHTKQAPFHQHFGRENIVRNNIFALPIENLIWRSQVEDHISFIMERNIILWEGDTLLLYGRWGDRTYMHRPGKPGMDPVEGNQTHLFDWNLYWNPDKTRDEIRFADRTWDEWQASGQDKNSRFADPGFADPHGGDFTLPADSPAWGLGFQPIDMSTVGPRR